VVDLNKKLIIAVLAVLLVIILFFTLYVIQNNYSSTSSIANTTAFSGVNKGLQLSMTLQANKTRFAQGEEVNMTFALTNVSNQTVNVIDLNPDSIFNFFVNNNKNNQVFHWRIGAYPPFNETIPLAPNENYTETFTWRQEINSNLTPPQVQQAPPGKYIIIGITDDDNLYVLRTEPLNITITNSCWLFR
jgi:hypothetical protein